MGRADSFSILVRARFLFLDNMGFLVVTEGNDEVRFEHANGVFVRVFHTEDDNYVGFQVGTRDAPRDAITDTELLHVSGVTEQRGLFPATADALDADLGELARRLHDYGGRALAGDDSFFERVRALRRRYTQRFTRP
jgi:hypothetical protein